MEINPIAPYLSKTQVENFLACPARWFAKYRLGVKEDISIPMMIGIVIHYTMELAGIHVFEKPREDLEDILFDVCSREFIPDEEHGPTPLDNGVLESPAILQRMLAMLRAVHRREQKRGHKILAVERDYIITLPNGLKARGVIDRFDFRRGNILGVTDYKTGSYVLAGDELKDDVQLKMYASMLRAMAKQPKYREWFEQVASVQLELFYLAKDKVSTVRFNDDDLDAFEAFLLTVRRRMERTKKAKPRLNMFCPSCGIRGRCPKYKKFMENPSAYVGRLSICDDDPDQLAERFDEISAAFAIAKKAKYDMQDRVKDLMKSQETDVLEGKKRLLKLVANSSTEFPRDLAFRLLKKRKKLKQAISLTKGDLSELLPEEDFELLEESADVTMSSSYIRTGKA